MRTSTGNFSIGFRRIGSDWQRRDLAELAQWARQSGFEAMDLWQATAEDLQTLQRAKLRLGSVDLLQFGQITQHDAGQRKELIGANVQYVKQAASWGARIFFTVIGGEAERTRKENYRIAVEAFSPIAEAAAEVGANLAIEGYPGGAPSYPLLCTTPETVRAFLKDLPRGVALNYDPSHLIRLGVDHVRFLREFVDRVVHVHGKDTQTFPQAAYELGMYQPSAFEAAHRFGQHVWRYAIPGAGEAKWAEVFGVLKAANYAGVVSVELEDENYNGSESGEKEGLVRSLESLREE